MQSPVSCFWVARNALKPPMTSSASPVIDPDRSIRNETCTGTSASGPPTRFGSGTPGVALLIRSATSNAAARPPIWVSSKGQTPSPWRAPRHAPAMAAMVSVSPPALTALRIPSTGVPAVAAHHNAAGTASRATGPVPSMLNAASGLCVSIGGRIRIRSMTVAPLMSPWLKSEQMSATAVNQAASSVPSPFAARATAAANAAAAEVATGCPWVTKVDRAASYAARCGSPAHMRPNVTHLAAPEVPADEVDEADHQGLPARTAV